MDMAQACHKASRDITGSGSGSDSDSDSDKGIRVCDQVPAASLPPDGRTKRAFSGSRGNVRRFGRTLRAGTWRPRPVVLPDQCFQRVAGQYCAGDVGTGSAGRRARTGIEHAHFPDQAARPQNRHRHGFCSADRDVFDQHFAVQQQHHEAGVDRVSLGNEGFACRYPLRAHITDNDLGFDQIELHQGGRGDQQLGRKIASIAASR